MGPTSWSRCAGGSSRTGRRSQDPLQHLQHPLTGDHGLVGLYPLLAQLPDPGGHVGDDGPDRIQGGARTSAR